MTLKHRIILIIFIILSYPLALCLWGIRLFLPVVVYLWQITWESLNFPHALKVHILQKWGYLEKPKLDYGDLPPEVVEAIRQIREQHEVKSVQVIKLGENGSGKPPEN